MKAELIGVDDARWSELLGVARHDFYHLPGYAALSARQEGAEAAALWVMDGVGALLLPLLLRPIPGSTRDAASPYGYPGPLVAGSDDPSFTEQALEAGRDTLRSAGIVSLFVRLHPLLNPIPPRTSGRIVSPGETVSIDLTLPAEMLWRQTRRDHRHDIDRALRAGHRASFDDAWVHFETFKRIYRTTMDRVSAGAYYFFDDAYFDGLRSALGARLRLCVVEAQGAIAAAGLFVETCGIVQFHLSGTEIAFVHARPTKLMIHFVREWAKERGDTTLHLGGGVGGAADSLFRFKSGFSPLRHPYHTIRDVIDRAEYGRLEKLHGGSSDPDGFFPSYREPTLQAG